MFTQLFDYHIPDYGDYATAAAPAAVPPRASPPELATETTGGDA